MSDNQDTGLFHKHNPLLSKRPQTISREMTTWSYRGLRDLFYGNESFALYMNQADCEAVFFHEHGRCWFYSRHPSGPFDQAAPEVVEDWIGSSAPKEPGAEPVLMHRDELPKSVKAIIQHVRTVEPEHAYEAIETEMVDE